MAVQTKLMASTTRSSRRATRHTITKAFEEDALPKAIETLPHPVGHKNTHSGRSKRPLTTSEQQHNQPASKRPRTSEFEIVLPSKSWRPQSPDTEAPNTEADASTTESNRRLQKTQHQQAGQRHQPQNQTAASTRRSATDASNPSRGNGTPAAPLTKHQEKVINGIKHELDRLQPTGVDTKEQRGGRKLRSQEASRFKSELSAYFPDYDEVIGNEPKEQHLLNIETPIVVDDTFPRYFQGKVVAPLFTPSVSEPTPANYVHNDYPARGYGDNLFHDLFDSQRINFDFLGNSYKDKTLEDPLADELYMPVHKKAERLERSIRNTEKGRAQHEKDQIIRLLEGLQGHDWLRTMGVSGVTEGKKKTFEPARQHFIKGCQSILDKFRQWSLAEKRRKAEKERALAEEAENEEADQDDEHDVAVESEAEPEDDQEEVQDSAEDDDDDSSLPVDENDVDASIAKQLRQEAAARSRIAKEHRKQARTVPPPKPEPPLREFKSFFKKKHERDTALNKNRRAGRRVLAWGEPVPEMLEQEFELPEEYLDPEVMKAHARKRRRERRGSRH